jgi:hypothetical protein
MDDTETRQPSRTINQAEMSRYSSTRCVRQYRSGSKARGACFDEKPEL